MKIFVGWTSLSLSLSLSLSHSLIGCSVKLVYDHVGSLTLPPSELSPLSKTGAGERKDERGNRRQDLIKKKKKKNNRNYTLQCCFVVVCLAKTGTHSICPPTLPHPPTHPLTQFLRNHQKITLIDHKAAFCGGLWLFYFIQFQFHFIFFI